MPRKPAKPASRTQKQLAAENEDLRTRLAEAEDILRAIHSGEVDAILVSGADGDQIFTLRQAEDALQKAKDRAQLYLDIAAVMFLVLTADGKVVLINKRGCEILGYAEQEIVGLNWSDHFLPQAEKDGVATHFDRIMSDGIGQREYFESHVLTKSGQKRLIGWHSAVLTDEDDQTIGIVSSGADITERKQAEEMHAQLAAIVDSSDDAIFSKSLDGILLTWNRGAEGLYGYSADEMIGRSVSVLIPREQPNELQKIIEHVEQGTVIQRYETSRVKKDGARIQVSLKLSPIRDATGRIVSIASIAHDITERKQAEDALQKAKAREKLYLDIAAVMFLVLTADGKVVLINKRGCEILGYAEQEIVGLNWSDHFLPQAEKDGVATHFDRIMLDGIGQRDYFESHVLTKNGQERLIGWHSAVLTDEDDQTIGIVSSGADITESKRVEAELRREKQFLETLNLNTPVAITVLDDGGNIVSYNPAFERMFGYAPSEIVGKNLDALISTDETIQDAAASTLQAREGPVHEFGKRHRKDGQLLTVEVFGVPVPLTEEKNGILAIYHDVTEQENARREAEQSNRAKGEFVANMSHELRTPMNGVIGMLELALDTILTSEQRDYLQTSLQSAESLLTLLNDILDFSKIEAGRLSIDSIDFNLRTTVENVADTLAKRAEEKGLELACLVHPDLVSELRGDPARLRQILFNLAGNAVKFTHQGEVVIQVNLTEDRPEHVIIHFAVQDTGVGIPLERQGAVFDRFTQADGSTTRKYGGTGLGLTISKQLVEMMGGTMGLDSVPGVGSTFWFNLKFEKQPREKQPREKRGTAPLSLDVANLSYARILIVDDNQTNRTVLTRNIQAFGSQVDSVPSGAKGLEVLRNADRAGAPYHVVLLDMQMPGMDGEQTARAIKSDPAIKDVKIIILTSLGQRGDAVRLEALGCSAYLVKPVKQQVLFDAVITVLGRKEEAGPGLITRHILSEQRKSNLRLLLAEDNPINQKLAVILLQKAGYSVDAVETGLQALQKVQANHYNAVLMDVQMPEMDGFQATHQIREWEQTHGTHIPIIAMTAHAMVGDRERCLEAGMDDYITKPMEPNVLFSVLDRWTQAPGSDLGVESSTSVEAMQDYSSPASFQATNLDDGLFGESRPAAKFETEVEAPAFQTTSFIGIPPADFESALPHFDNDRDFMLKMFKEYKTHLGGRVDEIHAALLDCDMNRLARLAHNLKGVSLNFSAEPLATICLQLEEICKREDLTHAPRLVAQLEVEARRLEEFLSRNL